MVLLRRTPGYGHCKCCEPSSTLPSHSHAHVSGGLCANTAAVRLLVASLTDPSGGRGDYGGIDVPREIHLQRGDRRVIGAAQRSAVRHSRCLSWECIRVLWNPCIVVSAPTVLPWQRTKLELGGIRRRSLLQTGTVVRRASNRLDVTENQPPPVDVAL